jgi:hypothetical protein
MKLTQEQIAELVVEKEAELAREVIREGLEKSLKRLIRKASKQGFTIKEVLFAHMEKKLEDRWEIRAR